MPEADTSLPVLPEPGNIPLVPPPLLRPITRQTGLGAAASLLAAPPAPTVAVTLKAVGDIIPGTNYPNYRLPEDPNYLFNSVKPFLGETDILFGNFESTLTDYPYSAKDISRGMTFAFRTPPSFATVLQDAGFDVLSVANNHSFDFAEAGFNDTIAFIEQAGMHAVGRKGQIVTVEANEYAIAFIGFSYLADHNSMHDLATATALVQTAEEQADIVVISVHAGAEGTDALSVKDRTEFFFSENRGNLVQFSRAMVDAGADVILGHGPHVPRALELYQDRLIAYSLGNFLGYRTLSTVGPLGTSLILQLEMDETGNFMGGRVIPVALDPNGVPYIDNFFQSVALVRQLTAQDFPNTALEIDEMGYILRTQQ
ncbi:MAG: CapA family protein [Leptolyngbya sp. SIO1E4]|nr:CapA family protein [Leptolyngbya sp. SIO1E4]